MLYLHVQRNNLFYYFSSQIRFTLAQFLYTHTQARYCITENATDLNLNKFHVHIKKRGKGTSAIWIPGKQQEFFHVQLCLMWRHLYWYLKPQTPSHWMIENLFNQGNKTKNFLNCSQVIHLDLACARLYLLLEGRSLNSVCRSCWMKCWALHVTHL